MTTDPFVEILDHELTKLQTIHALKMSGMVEPPRNRIEERDNSELRSYKHTLNTIINDHANLPHLKKEYSGKEFRKQVQEWGVVLHKDARRMLFSSSWSAKGSGKRKAYMDVSRAIIASFKKLPKA